MSLILLSLIRTCSYLCTQARVRIRVIMDRPEVPQSSSRELVLDFQRGLGLVSAPSLVSIIEAASSLWW